MINLDTESCGKFPSIDLADADVRVAIQVTSTPTLEKVKDTLGAYLKDRPEFNPPITKRYDRLIVYVLTEKQNSNSQTNVDSIISGRFQFDASKDVWDYRNLLADIQYLSLSKKESVLRILKNQLGFTLSQIALTGLVNVPEGMRSPYLIGCDSIVSELNTLLTGDSTSLQMVVLTGLGGIGKTQAALEYVAKHSGSYSHVLWSNGESESSFLDSMKAIAHALLPITRRVENSLELLA